MFNPTQPLPISVSSHKDGGVFHLPLKQHKTSKFKGTKFFADQLFGPKEDMPLLDGWICHGTRMSYFGKRIQNKIAALVTLDVDNEDHTLLSSAVNALNDPRVFTSKSASGKTKAHMVVDCFDSEGNRVVPNHEVLAKCLADRLGIPQKSVDLAGTARCFLTASLFDSLTYETLPTIQVKEALAWRKLEVITTASPAPVVDENGEEVPEHKNADMTRRNTETMAEFLGAEGISGLSDTEMAVLATYYVFQKQAVSWLSWELACAVAGVGKTKFYAIREKLLKLGLIECYKRSVANIAAARFLVNPEIAVKIPHKFFSVDGILARYVERNLEEIVEGNFNLHEMRMCVIAVSHDLPLESVVMELSGVLGWECERRLKRLSKTFAWACRKHQK